MRRRKEQGERMVEVDRRRLRRRRRRRRRRGRINRRESDTGQPLSKTFCPSFPFLPSELLLRSCTLCIRFKYHRSARFEGSQHHVFPSSVILFDGTGDESGVQKTSDVERKPKPKLFSLSCIILVDRAVRFSAPERYRPRVELQKIAGNTGVQGVL